MGVEVVLPKIGCCAHVASVLWYLGYYCNETENGEAKPKKVHVDYVKDAAVDTYYVWQF